MQELKTVNWDFQVTLCPFSLPTLLFTPEARIGTQVAGLRALLS